MNDELRRTDASYAEDLKDLLRTLEVNCPECNGDCLENKMLGLNIVHNALIKMGLKETARQFTKLIKKI